jgi:hypothetical protein
MSHWQDSHCKETGSVHFHSEEHHCTICDFLIPISTSPVSDFSSTLSGYIQPVTLTFENENLFFSKIIYSFLLRGPPPNF